MLMQKEQDILLPLKRVHQLDIINERRIKMDYKKIKTSQEMNEIVKGLLAVSRIKIQLYALKRIEELEQENEELKQKVKNYYKSSTAT